MSSGCCIAYQDGDSNNVVPSNIIQVVIYSGDAKAFVLHRNIHNEAGCWMCRSRAYRIVCRKCGYDYELRLCSLDGVSLQGSVLKMSCPQECGGQYQIVEGRIKKVETYGEDDDEDDEEDEYFPDEVDKMWDERIKQREGGTINRINRYIR